MNVAKWMLFVLVPGAVLASPLVVSGAGRSAEVASIMAPMIAGLGFFPTAFALPSRPGWALAAATVCAACAGIVLAVRLSDGPADLPSLVGWAVIAFGVLCGLTAPLLVLGWRAAAAFVWLATSAAACGSVMIVAPGGGTIPEPALLLNPLIRMMRHGLDFDWLHAANVYPRVGTLYYNYPGRSDGIIAAVATGAGGLAISAVIAGIRRRSVTRT